MASNHVAILAGIVIILSFLSFLVTRNKTVKVPTKQNRSKYSVLIEKIDGLYEQIDKIKEYFNNESSLISSLAQANNSLSESLELKESLENIQENLQSILKNVDHLSEDIQSMKKNYSHFQDAGLTTPESSPQEPNPTVEMYTFPQDNKLPSLLNMRNVKNENLEETVVRLLPSQQPEPFEQVAKQYQDAINRGDRQAIRQMQHKELNITSESENSLVKGNSGDGTKLEAVAGGGSYLIIVGEERYWLFPTAQTLESFSINQPQKGIFSFEREILSKPLIKKPAEALEQGDHWIIKQYGIVSVPQ